MDASQALEESLSLFYLTLRFPSSLLLSQGGRYPILWGHSDDHSQCSKSGNREDIDGGVRAPERVFPGNKG